MPKTGACTMHIAPSPHPAQIFEPLHSTAVRRLEIRHSGPSLPVRVTFVYQQHIFANREGVMARLALGKIELLAVPWHVTQSHLIVAELNVDHRPRRPLHRAIDLNLLVPCCSGKTVLTDAIAFTGVKNRLDLHAKHSYQETMTQNND